jgi:hypothetical protein
MELAIEIWRANVGNQELIELRPAVPSFHRLVTQDVVNMKNAKVLGRCSQSRS